APPSETPLPVGQAVLEGPTMVTSIPPEEKPMPAESAIAQSRAKSKKRSPYRWLIAAAILILPGAFAIYQAIGYSRAQSEAITQERNLESAREELTRLQIEARKEVDAAAAVEREVTSRYQNALQASAQASRDKDFTVRLTGPVRPEPGAPNKWQI